MTIMRVTLAGTDLTAEQKADLARRLIDAFAQIEVGRSTPQVRAGFVVQIEQVAPGARR
jgi:phenylpyruvate tautomerase PptA (4-oxalocrotonate tautomerase family)